MLSLCNECHRKADATESRVKHLRWLRHRYGYGYAEEPWAGLLR
jgi:hypothetical protein